MLGGQSSTTRSYSRRSGSSRLRSLVADLRSLVQVQVEVAGR